MMCFKGLMILPAICLSISGISQTMIGGNVIDYDTQLPISKASVQIPEHSRVTLTDEAGIFQITYPTDDTNDTLVVTHVGYMQHVQTIPAGLAPSQLTIALKRETKVLDEVMVYNGFWTKEYTPRQLEEDYGKFCKILEAAHTGLFDYLTQARWQELKDSTMQLIEYPMSHREFFQLIALHVAGIRNIHTRYGVTDWWYRQKQNIFPFNVRYFDGRLYVAESLVKEASFPKGTEILEINGRTPAQIKSLIWPFIPADGYIETNKMTSLNDYFPWYFALFVEEAKVYHIKLKTLDNVEVDITTAGLRDSFGRFSFQQKLKWRKSSLELQIDDTLKTAYFRIEDSRAFKDSLHRYFERVLDHEVKFLMIDLRGNGGMREEEQIAELCSYLIKEPFRIFERIEVQSNDANLFDKDFTYKPYGRSLKHIKREFFDKLTPTSNGYYLWEREAYLGTLKPASLHFKGTIYILVDGRNYSASTDFTSFAGHLPNVYIVGEETGGGYRSYISGLMFGLVLPNSKIGVKVPNWKSVLAIPEDPSLQGRGVIPDFYVAQPFEDFLRDKDTIKEYTYDLIRTIQKKR